MLAIRIMCINVILRNDVLQVAYESESNMLFCFVFSFCFLTSLKIKVFVFA